MLWKMTALRGRPLRATDGRIGSAHDFLFDDVAWTVRYVVADTGAWLPGRRILLSPASFGAVGEEPSAEVPVNLSRRQIEESPPVAADRPVSRQMEIELREYFGWLPYWSGATEVGEVLPEDKTGRALEFGTAEDREGAPGDPHLRSMREVTGYHIGAIDGEIGHVEDFLVDLENWAVRYLVVDTRNWLPGKRVIIAPDWVLAVDWADRRVDVDLERERVEKCPEYDPSRTVDRGYEERLFRHYDKMPYWG